VDFLYVYRAVRIQYQTSNDSRLPTSSHDPLLPQQESTEATATRP
jgi:hypothetical protein